jgi:hypothetical protein
MDELALSNLPHQSFWAQSMKQALLWNFFLAFFGCTQAAPKRGREDEPEERLWHQVPLPKSEEQLKAEEELGQSLRKLFERNKISASESMEIMKKARKCGLSFANPANKSLPKAEKHGERDRNAARTVKRFMDKRKQWGNFYWACIPLWVPKKKKVEPGWLPFLLPHEWLSEYLQQPGAKEEAMPETGSYKSQKLAEMCEAWGNPAGSMVPLGLHGDGVPIQGRMNQSTLDVWCLNLPCSEQFQAERVPICCLETKYNAGPATCQAICEVIAWSLKKLGDGNFPRERHDGKSFNSLKDRQRKALAGEAMPAKATLIEVRSDWDWNMKWYGAPATNQTSGCCWLCAAKPGTWKALSKQERKDMSLTKAEWFENLASRNKTPNPIFHLPGVTNWTILPDWMHVADEGCGALAAGQILWEILSGYEHTNQECRVACLWEHINKIYEASNWPGEKNYPSSL